MFVIQTEDDRKAAAELNGKLKALVEDCLEVKKQPSWIVLECLGRITSRTASEQRGVKGAMAFFADLYRELYWQSDEGRAENGT